MPSFCHALTITMFCMWESCQTTISCLQLVHNAAARLLAGAKKVIIFLLFWLLLNGYR